MLMPARSATDSWQDMERHVRAYLRKKFPGKALGLDTVLVTGWESQILWVQSVGWGAVYNHSHTKKTQEATTYSEWTGLFLSSVGTDRNLQKLLLPWDGRNHLWQCSLLSSDFGESPPDKLLLDVGFQTAKGCCREPCAEQFINEDLIFPNLSAGQDNEDHCFLRKSMEQISEPLTSIRSNFWKIRGVTKPGRCYCSSVGRGHWQTLA